MKYHIPSIVFKEVDFFYGLEEDDPPYLYLGCILSYPLVKDATVVFQSITDNDKTWGLNWTRSAKGHTKKSFAITTIYNNEITKTILVTYFHEPQFRKNAFIYEGNNIRLLYSEFWNAERTRIWCGLPKKTLIVASGIKDSLPVNPEPLEPFGTWITE